VFQSVNGSRFSIENIEVEQVDICLIEQKVLDCNILTFKKNNAYLVEISLYFDFIQEIKLQQQAIPERRITPAEHSLILSISRNIVLTYNSTYMTRYISLNSLIMHDAKTKPLYQTHQDIFRVNFELNGIPETMYIAIDNIEFFCF
jgi:hypothetical protein